MFFLPCNFSHVSRFSLSLITLALLPPLLSTPTCRAAESLPGYVVLPISLVDGANQAILPVTINGRPTSLVLDTGASTTLLDGGFYKGARSQADGDALSKLPPEFQNQKVSANGEKAEVGYVSSLKSGPMDWGAVIYT